MGLPKYVFNKNADFALEHWHCSTADLIPGMSLPAHLSIVSLAQMSGTDQNQDSCAHWVTARSWLTPPSERQLLSVHKPDVSMGSFHRATSLEHFVAPFRARISAVLSFEWYQPTKPLSRHYQKLKGPFQPRVFTTGKVSWWHFITITCKPSHVDYLGKC